MHVKNRLSSIENEICITLTIRDGIIDIVGKTTMVIFADHMFESSKFWVRSFFYLSFSFSFFSLRGVLFSNCGSVSV